MILRDKRRVATQFAIQLLELYESNEYHILDLFDMYIGFLKRFGGHTDKHDLRRITDWQMKDMKMSIWNDNIDYTKIPLETAHNKNRRSGKTKDATRLGTFFGILNKEVKWRSAYMNQQRMAKFWYSLNPFVKKINNYENNIYLRGPSEYPINLGVLTSANVTGVECDVAMFDEGGWVFQDLKLYEAYKNARPMVAPSNFKHIIHFSTPARYSAFQEAWLEIESFAVKMKTTLTVLRTYLDCPWITPEFLAYEELMNKDCPWYINQNYKGIWVVYGGAVFSNFYDINDEKNVSDEIREAWDDIEITHGGVDWNGQLAKHYLVLGTYTPKYVFVKEELKFLDITFLKNYMNNISLELEDNDPYSNQFADDAKEMFIKANYFGWDMPHKMERVRQLQARTVIIDKVECPTTWKNFQEAGLDKSSRLPMLEKRPDQHGLDGTLHMIHPVAGPIDYGRTVRKRPIYRSPLSAEWRL